MEMTACNVCGKIFGTSSDSVCPSCRKLLDIVYEKARAYLRDHPKESMNARELAKAIGEDERLVEMLMIEGRFENKNDGEEESEAEKKRKLLLEDLQKNLASTPQKQREAGTYGSDRHGTRKEK
jgi:rubrerythrin